MVVLSVHLFSAQQFGLDKKEEKQQKQTQKHKTTNTMSCLSCHHITLASSSTSPETNHNQNPPIKRRTKPSKNNKQKHLNLSTKQPNHPNPIIEQHRKQLAMMEMERAIGAGAFRDNEPRDLDKKKIVFHGVLPDFNKVFEGAVEKQIRETGEWVANNTEQAIRSSRKGTLIVFVQWILPIWTLSVLLASGAVKLPFSIPLIDNLIM